MVLVALAVRLAVIPFTYHEWMDPFVLEHWAFGLIARSIASGHGFGSPFAETGSSALLPPVYSYLLACIFKVFGIETRASVLAALSLNSLLSALTCVPVFLLARQAFGPRVAKWAGWGWAFSPYGVYYGADWAWSTCLVTLELSSLFLFALQLGLSRPWRAQAFVVALAGIATLSPWLVRNYELFHRFIPVRSGFGLELYIGNNGYSQHWVNRALHPNHNDAELSEYERVGEIAYMDDKLQQGKDFIRIHPAWFAWMTLRRIVYMWTGYWSFDRAYLKDEPLDPPNIFVNTTMTLLGLWGLRRVFQRDPTLAVRFAIVLLFFPLTYYISHPETYYFRPVDPLIVVLAAVAVAGRSKDSAVLLPLAGEV